MGHPDLTLSNLMGNSIGHKGFKVKKRTNTSPLVKHKNCQWELPPPIPWNQTLDAHRGSTLIT